MKRSSKPTSAYWFWLAVLTLLAILPSCSFSTRTAKKLLDKASAETYDLIVVPGVPFENGNWNRVMKGRVYWSKYLYDRGIAKNIMYSGAAVYSPYVEAEIMALYAQALGIPTEHIFTETTAEHSTENIFYSYQKAKQLGFQKIALASDPFQTKLLQRFVRKRVSPEIALIPFVMDTLQALEPTMIDPVIDYEQAFVKDFVSLLERENFWQRWKGTQGKNINESAYQ